MVGGGALLAPHVKNADIPPAYIPEDNTLFLTVMSYNIRTVNLAAGLRSPDYWENRKEALIQHILENDPDVIGTQEVFTPFQDVYLEENLPEYANVGIARNGEGALFSEKNLILYKKDKFTLLDSGTFWLSDTPDTVSKGWDGDCYRICTYALLKDNKTEKVFKFFNTHFDHKGLEARQKGAALVLDTVVNCGYPAILTGDFNFHETDPNYESMTLELEDTKYVADSTMSYGTYHGYSEADLSAKTPIDFCLITPDHFSVESYEVLYGKHFGVFTSDHFAVKVEMSL